jgi:hypothetical protein
MLMAKIFISKIGMKILIPYIGGSAGKSAKGNGWKFQTVKE